MKSYIIEIRSEDPAFQRFYCGAPSSTTLKHSDKSEDAIILRDLAVAESLVEYLRRWHRHMKFWVMPVGPSAEIASLTSGGTQGPKLLPYASAKRALRYRKFVRLSKIAREGDMIVEHWGIRKSPGSSACLLADIIVWHNRETGNSAIYGL